MEWEVEFTDEFEAWWHELPEAAQISVAASVELLEKRGPQLAYPHSSAIHGSRHSYMRELRVQHKGEPLRVLYAFDPRRVAILLLGGNKVGDDDWYSRFIPIADELYEQHLKILGEEGLL